MIPDAMTPKECRTVADYIESKVHATLISSETEMDVKKRAIKLLDTVNLLNGYADRKEAGH